MHVPQTSVPCGLVEEPHDDKIGIADAVRRDFVGGGERPEAVPHSGTLLDGLRADTNFIDQTHQGRFCYARCLSLRSGTDDLRTYRGQDEETAEPGKRVQRSHAQIISFAARNATGIERFGMPLFHGTYLNLGVSNSKFPPLSAR